MTVEVGLEEAWLLAQYNYDGPLDGLAGLHYVLDDVEAGWLDEASFHADVLREARRVQALLSPPPPPRGPFR